VTHNTQSVNNHTHTHVYTHIQLTRLVCSLTNSPSPLPVASVASTENVINMRPEDTTPILRSKRYNCFYSRSQTPIAPSQVKSTDNIETTPMIPA